MTTREPSAENSAWVSVADGLRPQQLLLTLLGDYWLSARDAVPSAALVEVLADFGVSETNARAALSRVSRRGFLHPSKVGRFTSYSLTVQARESLEKGLSRIMTFAAPPRPWRGEWTWIAFSVPEAERAIRPQVRGRLRWHGFAPLYDGLWISPRPLEAQARAVLEETGIAAATVMVGRDVAHGGAYGRPTDAWDLDAIRHAYKTVIDAMQHDLARVSSGTMTPAESLVARTRVMDRWRQLPPVDPELPTELLPEKWPRNKAFELFHDVYERLGEAAVDRVRTIVSRHPGGQPEQVRRYDG